MKADFENLGMGIVKQNFVIIEKKDKPLWISRGFEEHRKFTVFHHHPLKRNETMMLGKPETLGEFGIENFIDSRIADISLYHGTYGMGGPGFFGILCDTKRGAFYLTYAVWASGEYVMTDGRVLLCFNPDCADRYNPWVSFDCDDAGKAELKAGAGVKVKAKKPEINRFRNAVIKNIELSGADCKMKLLFEDNTEHEMIYYKYSENLPPRGSGSARKEAFKTGVMADYLLVTYDKTVLHV